MKKKLLFVGVTLLLMYLSSLVGFRIGVTKTSDLLFTRNVNYASTEVKTKVKILEMLNKGENEKLKGFLERIVDIDLGFLADISENKHVIDKSKLMETIIVTKRYREKCPEHKVESTLNGSSLFQGGCKKVCVNGH